MDRCVLVAVSGGIAAYKAAELVSRLVKAGVAVRVIMTENACRFVVPTTFEALTGTKVYTDTFEESEDGAIQHIALAQQAGVFAAVPATASLIAKMAAGLADDMVTSTFLATTCPVVVCPAMHTRMYTNPAVQANLSTLKERGVTIVGPGTGRLARGEEGEGVLAPVEQIERAILTLLDVPRDA